MKKILFAIILLISANAYAGMWFLIHSEYVGSNWFCTYQLQGTNYQTTIIQSNYCPSVISQ